MKGDKLIKSVCLFVILSIITSAAPSRGKENIISAEPSRAENLFQRGEYRQAIEVYNRIIPSLETQERAIAYYNLAVAENRLGSKTSALGNLKQAIPLLQEISTEKYIVANLLLAQLYLDTGILSEAELILEPTIALAEEANLSNSEAIGRTLLGNLNLRYDLYSEAIEQYQLSWEKVKNPTTLISLSQAFWQRANAAALERELIEDPAEIERLQQSQQQDLQTGYNRAKQAISLSKTNENKISSRINLLKYFSQFLTPSEFAEYKNEARAIVNELPDSSYKASSSIAIAAISNNAEALRLLSRSRAIAETIDDRALVSLSLENIGKINLEENNLAAAETNTESAILLSEEIVNSERLFFQFWQLAKIELARNNENEALAAYQQALWNLRSNRGNFTVGNNNLLFYLQDEAKPFLRDYITLLLSSPSQERIKRAIEIISVLKLSELQSYFNDPCFDLVFQVDTKPEAETISPERANIYKFIGNNNLYLISETKDGYNLRTVNITANDLDRKLKEYRNTVVVSTGSAFVEPSKELYNILVAPVINDLPDTVKILNFSRDREIENIPLETLIDSQDRYLIEKYQITYSAGLERNLIRRDRGGEKIVFGLSESQIEVDLKFATQEVEAIGEIIQGETFLDREFTKAALNQTIQRENISFLHIATHGSFQGTAKNSYIEAFDGKISLNTFKNFLLSARNPMDLLTLSGCETALGNERATLGFAGVSVRARIPNVIGTLWSIPDNVTAVLMEEFYRNLSEGKTVPEAKQIAQLKIIELGENPRSWAGIILITN